MKPPKKLCQGFAALVAAGAISACQSTEAEPQGEAGPQLDVLTTATELVRTLGRPRIFTVDCKRHAFDAATGVWQPQPGFVRTELWLYPSAIAGRSDVFTMVNEEIIKAIVTEQDITRYPEPNIDPRAFGCAEPLATVERVIGGTRTYTTQGTDLEQQLNLGNVQLQSNYYVINSGASGVMVIYANGKMVGMQSL